MLEIRSLGKRYPGGTVGLADFSLEIGRGRPRAARPQRRRQDDADVDPRDRDEADVRARFSGKAATRSREPDFRCAASSATCRRTSASTRS